MSVDGLSFLPSGRAEILHLGRLGEREEINSSVITELWSEIDVRTRRFPVWQPLFPFAVNLKKFEEP